MNMKTLSMNKGKEKGAVLVVGLILMIVLIILGIATYNMTSVGEILSSNQRNKNLAQQASESAMYDAEQWLKYLTQAPVSVSPCATSPCNVWEKGALPSILQTQTPSWWQTNARAFSGILEQVQTQPRYIIEEHSFVPYELSPDARSKGEGYYFYIITTRGTGGEDEATAVTESTYVVQYR